MPNQTEILHKEIRDCRICEPFLPLGANPIFYAPKEARVVLIGQAPGTRVHKSGIPWNDPSGDQLRTWLGLSKDQFYDQKEIAIVPMGLCYPGTGRSGDLPPRKECAPKWHHKLLEPMNELEYKVLIGSYAIRHHLDIGKRTLADVIQRQFDDASDYLLFVHPSPRNRRWLKSNPWFEREIVPVIRAKFLKAVQRT